MTSLFPVLAVSVALLATAPLARAQSTDPRVDGLVRSGAVRVAVFPPQYKKDPVSHEIQGWPVDLAAALAARLEVKAATIEYPGPREAMEGLKNRNCDVAFLPIEPSWRADVDFSAPFMQIDFTLMVASRSSARTVADLDRPGVRIAVVNRHASTLALGRIIKQAALVGADSPAAAFELLRNGQADALASVRPALIEFAEKLAGSAVLQDRYGANFLTIAVAKGEAGRLAYFDEFIADAKTSGLVQRAIDRAGWRGVQVAVRPSAD
jgi:polar amino acid transport system substrate-binding protein